MIKQTTLFKPIKKPDVTPDLDSYDKIIVAFSGGKDSTASFLQLLEMGVPKEKIELWHHKIDGDTDNHFMDWPVTTAYCKAFGKAFNVPIYFSWKHKGFKGEMLREEQATKENYFELPDGSVGKAGGNSSLTNTRLVFPQTSADLNVRWCSGYLKIDVCAAAIRNQDRFRDNRTLVITGERGEESNARSKYNQLEPHKSDLRNGKRYQRHVDHWRPILNWYEAEVWNIIEKYKIRVHPAYYAGFGRVSCAFCIFANKNQMASAAKVLPAQIKNISDYESDFKMTIKQGYTIDSFINGGTPYQALTSKLANQLRSLNYNLNIIMEKWELPAGAFGETDGPT